MLLEQMQQPLLLTMFCEVLCTAHKEWSIPCRVESQPGPGYLCPVGNRSAGCEEDNSLNNVSSKPAPL